jgi:hypothetical protein
MHIVYVNMPPPKDPTKRKEWQQKLCEARKKRVTTEETRRKLSESHKGRMVSEETRKKLSEKLTGRVISDEWREKLCVARRKRVTTDETRKKMSEAHLGIRNHNYGKSMSDEQREKISVSIKSSMTEERIQQLREASLGKYPSEETRRKMGDSHRGERHPMWLGGISFEPYCQKFNAEFKERVRAFFEYRCTECGSSQNGEKLHVHHVAYNKEVCCDDTLPLFVALCKKCHTKTNHNREYWHIHFTELIQQQYGGKCYFTKEELISL